MLAQVNAGLGIAAGALLLKIGELAGWGGASPATFRFALLAMGAVALAGVVDSLRLPADAGAQVSGQARVK